jgi:hypothetical protein
VSPTNGILGARETLLIDAGNLTNPPGRDADRIVAAMKDAGVERDRLHGRQPLPRRSRRRRRRARRQGADPPRLRSGAFADELAGNRAAGFNSYLPVRAKMHVTVPKPG